MRWERNPITGRLQLVAGDPTPEEAAAGDKRVREMLEERRPPAGDVWNPDSTILAMGRPMGRKEYRNELKARGYVEISQKEVGNVKKNTPTLKDIAKSAVEEARKFLQKSGQMVDPAMPTTDQTKDRIAKGLPVLDRMPEEPEEPRVAVASEADVKKAVAEASEPLEPIRVDTPARPGLPWGYVGDKEDFRAAGIQAAIARRSTESEGVQPV